MLFDAHSRSLQRSGTRTVPILAAPVAPARACSDAGPYNGACNDGGSAWISCAVHTDCPDGQLCDPGGVCFCGPCAYGETCTAAGCACAPEPEPTPGPGCTVEPLCGSYVVTCADAGVMDAGPVCTTDGATPIPCTTDADCTAVSFLGGPLVCTARGVCDCPSAPPAGMGGGCSVAGRRQGSSAAGLASIAALVLVVAHGRRRRGAR